MNLAQLIVLRNDINANTNLIEPGPTAGAFVGMQINLVPSTQDGAVAIAGWYNTIANPAFIGWKTNVSIRDIGDNIVASELAGLSSLNSTRLQTIVVLSEDGINPAMVDRRTFFDDIFSGAGGTGTRAKLAILWRRSLNRIEKLLASGTGSDAVPATMSLEGNITGQDVLTARNTV